MAAYFIFYIFGLLHSCRLAAAARPREAPSGLATSQGKLEPVSDANVSSHAEVEGLILPDCPHRAYTLASVVEQAKAWCNAKYVPGSQQAPQQVQGLYWLKGSSDSDQLACFSLGKYDKGKRTLSVKLWSSYMFKDSYSAMASVSSLYHSGMTYKLKFDKDLKKAKISTSGGILGSVPLFFLNQVKATSLEHVEGSDWQKWEQPVYYGIWPFRWKGDSKQMWKLLDGSGQIIEENVRAMEEALGQDEIARLIRFPEKCRPEEHSLKFIPPGSALCEPGVLITVANQPELAILHTDKESVFAKFTTPAGCSITYKLGCQHGFWVVSEEDACPPHVKIVKRPASSGRGAFKKDWEVCSDVGGDLHTSLAMVDQTWSSVTSTERLVSGCVRLLDPTAWPELDAVRGSLETQQAAIAARKSLIGGCPLFRSSEDREERPADFKVARNEDWAALLQDVQTKKIVAWQRGSEASAQASAVELAFFGHALPVNRTAFLLNAALLNCGEPSPSIGGPTLFRHHDVSAALADPTQRRIFSTATSQQLEVCFQPSFVLFHSSGSDFHTQLRLLLDEAGFATMHEAALPQIKTRPPSKEKGESPPSSRQLDRDILASLMEAIWGTAPLDVDIDVIARYPAEFKNCIFGKTADDLDLLPTNKIKVLKNIRAHMLAYATKSQLAQKAASLLNEEKYSAVNKVYTEAAHQGEGKEIILARDIGEMLLHNGLEPTRHMTQQCIKQQWKDVGHRQLYTRNKEAYLQELMRQDGGVSATTSAFKDDTSMMVQGHVMKMRENSPLQLSLATANRDEAVFANASSIDPRRPNLDKQVAWNGELKHVIARDYEHAPRFCPGYQLSLQIAMSVCDHYTSELNRWTDEDNSGSNIFGVVMPLVGQWANMKGAVSHYDFKKDEHCLVLMDEEEQPESPAVDMGCYKKEDLKVIDKYVGGYSNSMEQEKELCPDSFGGIVNLLGNPMMETFLEDGLLGKLVRKIVGTAFDTHDLSPRLKASFSDEYSTLFYTSVLKFSLRAQTPVDSSEVKVPTRRGQAPTFHVGHVYAPRFDIDKDDALKSRTGANLKQCLTNLLTDFEFNDELNDTDHNQWGLAFEDPESQTMKDWFMSFYSDYRTKGGGSILPIPENDLTQMFFESDRWNDGLERAIAFDLIAPHWVKSIVGKSHGGESLPFVVRLNDFYNIKVRPGFGKFQGDMYFTTEGVPAMIELGDKTIVDPTSKDWAYWKFVWRSSLITIITFKDHLHETHFKAANTLAKATRKMLTPEHPLRRLLSIFTYGTIDVNSAALHALSGERHALHRASPFAEFVELGEAAPDLLEDYLVRHSRFLNDTEFVTMPEILQQSPYYADGKLVFKALEKMLKNFAALYKDNMCNKDGKLIDPEMVDFREGVEGMHARAQYDRLEHEADDSCDMFWKRLLVNLWTVTGFHRHVGTVIDYFIDPAIAGFSWKEGELVGRPKQTLILSVIGAFTGIMKPKLWEDYTHVFAGMDRESEATKVWQAFTKDLVKIKDEIRKRNLVRVVKNYKASPDIVECSVAV